MTVTNEELKQLAIKFWRDLQYEDFDAIQYLVNDLVDLIDFERVDQEKLAELVEQLEDHADEDCEPASEPKAVAQTTSVDDMIKSLFGDV